MTFSVGLLIGKIEAALGEVLHRPALKEKGLAKQRTASEGNSAAAKPTEPVPPPGPTQNHDTPEERLAGEGAPGATVLAGEGGHVAL